MNKIIIYYEELSKHPITFKDVWTGRWLVIIEARRHAKRMLKFFGSW